MRAITICFFIMFFFTSCGGSINKEDLVGEWKYVKILSVSNPAESTGAEEIAKQQPSIRFTADNRLIIMWGGKSLSHGKFRVDGKMIRYREELPDGKSREFPFLVSELSNDKLVFETMEREAIRVTAVRLK